MRHMESRMRHIESRMRQSATKSNLGNNNAKRVGNYKTKAKNVNENKYGRVQNRKGARKPKKTLKGSMKLASRYKLSQLHPVVESMEGSRN